MEDDVLDESGSLCVPPAGKFPHTETHTRGGPAGAGPDANRARALPHFHTGAGGYEKAPRRRTVGLILCALFHHGGGAVGTDQVDVLCGPDGLTAAGADIFPGAAGFLGLGVVAAHAATANNGQLVSPVLGRAEGLERRGWLGDTPANFRVIVDEQAPLLRFVPEALVVVGVAPAGILNAVQVAVVVDHFVDQGRYGVGNGPVQGLGTQVDFMGLEFLLTVHPDLIHSEVAVGLGAGLDGDNGHGQRVLEILFVQC